MSTFDVTQRPLSKDGLEFVELRREDGHGSEEINPSFVQDSSLLTEIQSNFSGDFARILEKRFLDTEEVRYSIPPTAALANSSIYTGIAPDGTSTSDAVWTVVRVYFNASKLPERQRIRFNVAWDNHTAGWT